MNNLKVLIVAVMVSLSGSVAAEVTRSPDTLITRIDSRQDGIHSIYVSNGDYNNDESCDFMNRAIIDVSSVGAKDMLAAALTAGLSSVQVKIVTEGCTGISSTSAYTAPKILAVMLLNMGNI